MSSIDCAVRLAEYQRGVELSVPRGMSTREKAHPYVDYVTYATELRSGGVPPCREGVPRPHLGGWDHTSAEGSNGVTARDAVTTRRRDATATMFVTYATEVPA
jgi:hypothetical protein